MKYEELKRRFEEGIDRLPKTLDAETKYYGDVKKCVEVNISTCERFKHDPSGTMYKSALDNLKTLYKDLFNKEKWNAPRPTLSDFKNKMY